MNENQQPSVSVVIPTYNRAKSVSISIESLLHQTITPNEIIVVDDGSEDDTPQLLENYSGKITVLRQENQGVSAARNAGIRRAQGEWVGFLDSDDVWYPERLEVFHKDFLECQESFIIHRVNMRLSGRSEQYEDDFTARRILERDEEFRVMSDYFDLLCKGAPPTGSIVRRDAITDVGGFDQTLSYGEDTVLFCALHNKGACFFRKQVLAELRRLPNDVDALDRDDKRQSVEFWEGLDEKWEKISRHALSDKHARLVRDKHAVCLYRLARIGWEKSGRADFATLYRAAFTHPSLFKGLAKSLACVIFRDSGYRFATEGKSRWCYSLK